MYTSVNPEAEIDRLLDDMNDEEVTDLVRDLLADGYVPNGWMESRMVNLSDPAVLLETITKLRKLGYTVEPGDK